MILKLNTFGVTVDKGVIPPLYKGFGFSLTSCAIAVDKGTIPPKNYFKFKLNTCGVTSEPAGDCITLIDII